ncbi:hypothetical protein [Methylocella sp.]|uniref:hypothetical protein n=1 Tax=Methylocella sp. TaxID=1978226 RepID=UPI003782FEC6
MKAFLVPVLAILVCAAPAAAAGLVAPDDAVEDVTGAIGPDQSADALPGFDLSRNCAQAFASKEAVGNCLGREETSRAVVAQQWPTLSPRVRKLCASRVPEGGARAYSALADCALKESRLEKFRMLQSAR